MDNIETAGGVPLYDISGAEPVFGHMHPDDVHDAVASGKFSFPKGHAVPAFDPDGNLGTLHPEDAPEAFKAGYTYATPKDINDWKNEAPAEIGRAHV